VLAPGFVDEPDRFNLAVTFGRLTFPYLLLVTLTALFGGVLNALYRFAAAAAAPIALNVVMIGALLLFSRWAATPGHVLAIAVTVGGIVQCLLLAQASARAGMALRLGRPRLTAEMRRLLALMLPGAFGAGVSQINLLIGTMIASLLPTGAVSYLYYADRIYQLPLGVIGVAVGTALLPRLTRELGSGEAAAAEASQNRAVELALLVSLPATLALLVMPEAIIRVLFGRGAFQADSIAETAATLAAYAVGLPAFVLVRVLSPGFFARADTTTPMRIGVITVGANVALSLALAWPLAHMGLALATSLAAWLNAGLLYHRLWRDHGVRLDARLRRRLPRILVASLAMALLLAAAAHLARPLLAGAELARAATLGLVVLAGLGGFALFAHLAGAARFGELARLLRRR
jgi:putative peptidoglycan lipid II flippase